MLEGGTQADHHLLGRLPQIEYPPLRVAAVGRDLLERLDQVSGTIEIGDELLGGLVTAGNEFLELGTTDRTVADLFGELRASPREARRDREADADRIVDFMGDAGHQAAERGELLRFDQASLRILQLAQRVFGVLLGGLEVEVGLPLDDGIGAEY